MKADKKFFVRMAKWMAAVLVVSAVTVTSQSFVYADETFSITAQKTASSGSTTDTVSVSPATADEDDMITVTATTNDTNYYLAQIRYSYVDENQNTVYEVITPDAYGNYTFSMPEGNVNVYADYVKVIWDGTIDVAWYDPDATTYNIQYAAQLAGLSAIVNGIFNDYPLTETTPYVPHVNADGTPFDSNLSLRNLFADGADSDSYPTLVVGDISYIKAANSTGTTGAYNQVTTSTYWFGGIKNASNQIVAVYNFTDKTINLTDDIDMGGNLTPGTSEFVLANWSGPNYMPIGGQYLIYNSNGYTHLGSSFNGTFDGHGHIVDNIYCDRYATTAFGDGQSVGFIGRLGLHDNDPVGWYSNPVVKNVAVDGIIYSRRSVGGIVGKTGQSDGVTIENCLNFATVQNTDSKGVGGIAGAGWNDATIRNCANFGYIYTSYSNAGGISGSCEANVINSYNFGYVGAPSNKIEQAQALGTNNYDAVWTNCYWLTGSSAAVVYPAVYGDTIGSTITEIAAPANYKTAGFLTSLNAGSSSWMTGTTSNLSAGVVTALQSVHSLSSSLTSYDCLGVPVPSTF